MSVFGNYKQGTTGSLLNDLYDWGVPLPVVEQLTIGDDVVNLNSNVFARYKFFDGIEKHLFQFRDSAYKNLCHRVSVSEEGKLCSEFRLILTPNDTPGMVSVHKVPGLHAFLNRSLTNYMTDPWYKVHKEAGAFFQGGYDEPDGDRFFIEFWNPAGAQAYVDKVNTELPYWNE